MAGSFDPIRWAGGQRPPPLGVTWSTIAHEFGHALGGLADEYHQLNETYAGASPAHLTRPSTPIARP